MNFLFEHSEYLYFLWIIPVFVLARILISMWAGKQRRRFASAFGFLRLAPDRAPVKAWIKFVMRMLALAALIVAVANPQQGGKVENQKVSGAEVVFALDVSRSMLAEDVKPNRLERAKQLISQSMGKMGNDQVGLILYAGKAFPSVPMTPDKSSVQMQLRHADPDAISAQGTNLADVFRLAQSFYNTEGRADRILFIISDGEDHEGEWKKEISQLKNIDVRVFSIGVGTEKGGPIPLRNPRGTVTGYQKDDDGNVVITRLVENVLRELVEYANGEYVYLSSMKNGVDFINDVLSGAGRSEYERKVFTSYQSQYQWPLALALFLLLVESLLFERKTYWLQKLQRMRDYK